ncbi:MAG: glycosyltransferase family 2 protein [Vicinamibacterales bacterium]
MDISVILCTYNRCESLAVALESLARLQMPPGISTEILVVDNNSNDDTRRVVETFAAKCPGRFRYLFEGRPGKSHALNSGIRESAAGILAFVDDDVTVEPSWLEELTSGLVNGDWEGAGGRILPAWGDERPAWLPRTSPYALAPLALFDLGPEAAQLNEPPFGTNMAFRKRVFEKYGGFRVDLGPRPTSEIRSEDTEFGRRVLNGGERLRYEPAAVVYHPVSENRLRKSYFLSWWFGKGRANIREFGLRPDARYHVAHVPMYLLRGLVVHGLRWLVCADSVSRFERKLTVWGKAGEVIECYRQPQHSIERIPSPHSFRAQ